MPLDIEITIEGNRVKPWLFRPDGQVLERLEWLTDVSIAYDGSEQRRRLRGYPRRTFEFALGVSDRERRVAENLLFNWQARVFGVPVWMDSEPLSAQVNPGATTIPADTEYRDYTVGGLCGLMTSPTNYEILEVASIGPSSITVNSEVAGTWPAGTTTVFPIRSARMPDQVGLQRFTGADTFGRFRFLCVDDSDYTAATETTYRSYPVMLLKPNWTEDLREDFVRKLAELDASTGGQFVDDEAGGPVLLQSHRWLLNGRAEIDAFRQWLYARKGKLTAFWMPTWSQDFLVVADIGMAATTIDVEHSGYTIEIDQAIGRRDIRIELRNGTVYYRRITASVEVDDDVERLSINSALGANVDADDVALVSFMYPARLDADAAEIAWWTWQVAEASLLVRGIRNDI